MIAEKIAALFTSGVETSGEPDSVFPTINAVDTSLRQQAQTQIGGGVMAFHQTYDSELIVLKLWTASIADGNIKVILLQISKQE